MTDTEREYVLRQESIQLEFEEKSGHTVSTSLLLCLLSVKYSITRICNPVVLQSESASYKTSFFFHTYVE